MHLRLFRDSQIDVSHVLAETIRRSHYGESVSVLFNQIPYDTTQPYRHGTDTPSGLDPEPSIPSSYTEPDPPVKENFFAADRVAQPAAAADATPVMGSAEAAGSADETPRLRHADVRAPAPAP